MDQHYLFVVDISGCTPEFAQQLMRDIMAEWDEDPIGYSITWAERSERRKQLEAAERASRQRPVGAGLPNTGYVDLDRPPAGF